MGLKVKKHKVSKKQNASRYSMKISVNIQIQRFRDIGLPITPISARVGNVIPEGLRMS